MELLKDECASVSPVGPNGGPAGLYFATSSPTSPISHFFTNIYNPLHPLRPWQPAFVLALHPTNCHNINFNMQTRVGVDHKSRLTWELPGMRQPGLTHFCRTGQSNTETAGRLTRMAHRAGVSLSSFLSITTMSSEPDEMRCRTTSTSLTAVATHLVLRPSLCEFHQSIASIMSSVITIVVDSAVLDETT